MLNFGPHREAVALRKIGSPVGFVWYAFQCVPPDAVILKGCVSSGLVTRGKRKGRPRFDGEEVVTVVTEAEERAEFERYERESGKCGNCLGTKEEYRGWSREKGRLTAPCPRCGATGLAPRRELK